MQLKRTNTSALNQPGKRKVIDMAEDRLVKMGQAALLEAGNQMSRSRENVQKLFSPKNGGKKKFSKKFDESGKKKGTVKPIRGYQHAVDVEEDHPSEWYRKTAKKKAAK